MEVELTISWKYRWELSAPQAILFVIWDKYSEELYKTSEFNL